MKERPILFSGPMVRALLAGTKTQTRRAVGGLSKRFPLTQLKEDGDFDDPMAWGWKNAEDGVDAPLGSWVEWCPYGQPGDRLWVRETLKIRDHGEWEYAADRTPIEMRSDDQRAQSMIAWAHHKEGGTCVSIHMPRWASRITLELTGVRVERLQAITEADAQAEGCSADDQIENALLDPVTGRANMEWTERAGTAAESYCNLWQRINRRPVGEPTAWEENPWVWVVEFKRVMV